MKKFSAAICGLLWLAFSTLGLASTLTIESHNFDANSNGGGFSAYLGNNMNNLMEVYCVDYRNDVDPPQTYNVNIETPNLSAVNDGLANARYGLTTSFSFNSVTYNTVTHTGTVNTSGSQFGDAYDRYVMAAWLTTQYNLSQPDSETNNAIQSAIWELLDVDGSTFYNVVGSGDASQSDVAHELYLATNFMSNTSAFNAFASEVRVYTSTDTTSYSTGVQEMIDVVATPEPAAFALVGTGLVVVGLFTRRRKR